jgi:hypothetical protein
MNGECKMLKKVTPTKTPPRRARKTDDLSIDKVIRDFKKLPAVFINQQISELDELVRSDHFGPTRRVALLSLTMSGSDMIKAVETDRELALAFANAMDASDQYVGALKSMVSCIEKAQARLIVALCHRPDADSVIEEAKSWSAHQ